MPAYFLEIAIVVLGLGLLLADAFAESRNRLFIGVTALFGIAAVFAALFFVEREPGGPTWGIYATDTMSFSSAWHLTLSGRYNETRIDNTDQLRPAAGAGSLTGSHRFSRFNPAAGVSFTPSRAFSA